MKHFFALLMSVFLLAACTRYQSVTQTEAGSFIQLKGSFRDAELVIDSQPPILLDGKQKTFKLNGVEVMKFAVSQGTHRVQVVKNGSIVVDRKIFISEGNAFEIIVP
jgi:hypothetical protein